MAKITFKGSNAFENFLVKYWGEICQGEILKKTVMSGADIVADQIRANLEALPEEPFRYLQWGETFKALPKKQKEDLLRSFGLAPVSRDHDGNTNTKAGFDGYGSKPTDEYSRGIPNPLLARAVESGSSVREKLPFVRPAVNKTRIPAVKKMSEVFDAETKKIKEEYEK